MMGDKFRFLTSMILKVTEVKGHSNKMVLGVLLVLIILGAIYWLSVLDKEQYLIQRNFRLLNLWSHEISNKINSMNKVSELAFLEFEGQEKFVPIQDYLCKPLDGSFEAYQHILAKLCAAGLSNITIHQVEDKKEQEKKDEEKQSGFSILLDAGGDQLLSKIEYHGYSKKFKSRLILKANLDLSEFIEVLTSERIFEDVLLISNPNQEVIYQRKTKEYIWRNWKNLAKNSQEDSWFSFLENDAGDKDEPLNLENSPQLFYFESPHGEQFAVFTQSIYFPGERVGNNDALYIAGLVSGEQFRQLYLSISSTALFIALAGLLGLVVALPFIRLSMMGCTDPLKSFHVCILFFAMSMGSGLLTILFLDIGFFETGKRIINEHMEDSAEKIKNQAETELRQVLETLQYSDKLIEFSTEKKRDIRMPDNKAIAWKEGVFICDAVKQKNLLNDPDCYPDYSLIYWMDGSGNLRNNWTAKGFPGYETSLSLIERAYVSSILSEQKNLWHRKDHPEPNFFLEPIISWSTGINRVVASIPSQHGMSYFKEAPDSIQVAALQFEFLSLMKNVIVPPGIGFVVVDNNDSRVLFHSSQQRALREDFLTETDNNLMLRDLIWAGESGHVQGRYWGDDTHFYVLPFDDMPWTLVVYRDREILGSTSLVALVIAGSLFTLWILILFGIPWFAGWILRGNYYLRKNWLWPDQKYHESYRTLSILNCVLFVIGLNIFWLVGNVPEWLLSACLIISFVGFVASFIIFRHNKSKQNSMFTEAHDTGLLKILSYPYSFSTLISTYLLIFSVLPAISIMGAVYQKEMTAVVKHQLLELYQALNHTAKPLVKFSKEKEQVLAGNGIAQVKSPEQQALIKHGMVQAQSNADQRCEKSGLESGGSYGLLGFYPDFLFQSKWCVQCSNTNDQNNSDALFDDFYQEISQYFIPLKKNVENWGLIVDAPNNDRIQWVVEKSCVTLTGDFRTRVVNPDQPKYPLVTEHNDWHNLKVSVSANLPIQSLIFGDDWFKHQNPYTYILFAVLLGIWGSFIYKMPQITTNNTLFLFRPRRKYSELPLDLNNLFSATTPNLIVLGYPGQGKTQRLQQLISGADQNKIYLSLRNMPDQDWINYIESHQAKCIDGTAISIIIDQFEFRCNESLFNQKKLDLLEKLVYALPGASCHIHVISNVYPGVFPINTVDTEQNDADNQRDTLSARWHNVWEAFGLVYYAMRYQESDHYRHNEWLSGVLGNNTLHPNIWNKMSEDFLRPHYQAIWQSATLDEQLALFNLARDQFIHVKHPGLNSLLCKGLIHFTPHLCLIDDRFVSFVKYAGKRDQLEQFAKSHKEGHWSVVKLPLGIIFIVFVAFLAITQEEFRSIFPALISILPVLFQGMPDLTQVFKGSDKN